MSTLYSIGAMNQLGDTLEHHQFSTDDVTKLKQFKNWQGIKDILYGRAEIQYLEHLIDCDAKPYEPNDLTVEKHLPGGLWKWNPKIELYFTKQQKKSYEEGNKIRKELEGLKGKIILNANVLDYLLKHQELIPKEWKEKLIFFWGTIYRNSGGRLYVRYLYWDSSKWSWDYYWLDDGFDSDSPAALAS